ncbi:MAG TPA: DUF4276 family protein [Lamprocystis sp. (in: g-proteobacteria)]|nr:DUF4276 family protein [Lamprocystis sp. (in: g-proteobacteria)]
MRRLCIVCEGPTESEFVRACLAPHLREHGLWVYGSILQARSGRHRGGRVTIERLGRHLAHEYHNFDRITTLVDYYGFQDREDRNQSALEAAVLEEAKKWSRNGLDPRFVRPYVQMHEFEALLFADIEKFSLLLDGWSTAIQAELLAVRNAFSNPEQINDGPMTAPSKRILSIFANGEYSKMEHGPLIAEKIGLPTIRHLCPGFHEWVSGLEVWGDTK